MSMLQLLHPASETHANEHVLALQKARLGVVSETSTVNSGEFCARILSFGALDDPNVCPTKILACALSIIHPAHIAEMLAKQLIGMFASIGAVLSASQEQIKSAIPHSDVTFLVLRTIQALLSVSLREKFERKLNLSTYASLRDYLRSTLAHKEVEVVRLLLLDLHNGLIRDELYAQGTGNRVSFSPREVVKRALEIGAYGIVIVHNHPSGNPMPSADDVEMIKQVEQALTLFGIVLHDSIIVGRYGCYSWKMAELL